MSGTALRCPSCGSSNIVDDDLYSQAQLVCVDCGSVVAEGSLANDPVGGSDVSYSRTTAVTKKPCTNLIKGLERVKEICGILRVSKEIEERALMYFRQAYEHQSFINVTLERKEVLADQRLVGGVYQEMIKILKVEATLVNITDIIEAHCQEYKISLQHVPGELAEDSKDLTKRAAELVELAADSWLVTGRRPQPIMMAATYLAWQSFKPNKQRLRMSLEKFCHLSKVPIHRPAGLRITELKEVLCKLGRELPWVREAVTPDRVVQLVGEILEHRTTLLRNALRSHEEALQASSPAKSVNCVDPTAEKSSAESHSPKDDGEDGAGKAERTQEPEANWGKRVLFAPPCVIHPKRRRVARPGLDVTGDEEISDSEIESYIRSPQEAQNFAQTLHVLSSSHNT